MTNDIVAWLGILLLAVSAGLVVVTLGSHKPSASPDLGLRGYKRHEALLSSALFRTTLPVIQFVAGWFRVFPLARLRARADLRLWQAGDFLGITADEWFAMMLLSTAAGAAFGCAVLVLDVPPLFIPVLALFGLFLAHNAVAEATTVRRRRVARGLPAAIDLLALCISAGMTFPQALTDVVKQAVARDPITEEMRHMLRQLELGHSRAYALLQFAQRVPVEAVSDFAAAVTQAEARGTPIKDVLKTQATMLRMRRTIAVEEEAASASVKLTLPLAMMLVTVLVLIGAPMLLRASAFLS